MKRVILTGLFGAVWLLSLSGCVVEPARPLAVAPVAPVIVERPVVVAPRPVVIAPRPRVWRRACPVGFHLGRYGRRCWPN